LPARFDEWKLQNLLRPVPISKKIFVEFGVADYTEANTRFLVVHENWSGLVLDSDMQTIASMRADEIYWRYNLKAEHAFVTRETINQILSENAVRGEIGLLSIDIDGNDYWVWDAIEAGSAAIVVVEYNS
jgi:hypothetical protein